MRWRGPWGADSNARLVARRAGVAKVNAAPAALAQFDVFTTHPPRFAALARADWDSLPAQPAREWDGLPLGPIVFQTPRLVCVRLAP